MSKLHELSKLGQSIWYDNIRRGMITSGELQQMVESDGLLGVTSNPAIFEKAVAGSPDYDQTLKVLCTTCVSCCTKHLQRSSYRDLFR